MTLIGSDQGLLDDARRTERARADPGPAGRRAGARRREADLAHRRHRPPRLDGHGRGHGHGWAEAAAGTETTPVTLLTLDPSGSADAPPIDRLAIAPVRPSIEAVDGRRRISFGGMGMGNGQFVIDGRSFDPGRIDSTGRLGTVEEWTITNNSMMDHPFHIHVWPFKVVERSDGTPDPGWRDTVNVPTGGWVRFRMPITDFAGTTVYHCHILDHEDLGMMATIQVT